MEPNMKNSLVVATISAIAADIEMACRPVTAAAAPLDAARIAPQVVRSRMLSRFALAVTRNCGIAIVISVFFAAARGPSYLPVEAKRLVAVQHTSIGAGAWNDNAGPMSSARR